MGVASGRHAEAASYLSPIHPDPAIALLRIGHARLEKLDTRNAYDAFDASLRVRESAEAHLGLASVWDKLADTKSAYWHRSMAGKVVAKTSSSVKLQRSGRS